MKHILVAGKNSYIGTSFAAFLAAFDDDYAVTELDTVGDAWKTHDFSVYDTVYAVAGIAHQKETKENAPLYYAVNCHLALSLARKAKEQGVSQFIYLSSMSVYGTDRGVITPDTKPEPRSHYGRSKLMAEQGLLAMQSEDFCVSVLRPPMVYGKNCRGNFQSVVKLVKKLPVFPKVTNQRSMIYVDNLSSFVKHCIDQRAKGIFFPQDSTYMNTADMARQIACSLGRELHFSALLGLVIKPSIPLFSLTAKAFGSLIYRDTERQIQNYCVADTATALKHSV